MYALTALALAALSTSVSAHGVITAIHGANNVSMPGLSIADGTPRSCASPTCGAELDTTIFNGESALGKTNGFGTVDAAKNIAVFMGTAPASSANSASSAQGGLASLLGRRGLLSGLLGGGSSSSSSSTGTDAAGTESAAGSTETLVASTAGQGAESGLPTADEDGTISMTLHQVNQDGAGPFSAAIDSTSGGTDASAFSTAEVTSNVAGFGPGLSAVTTTDFPVSVKVPAGTVCSASVGGAKNVCIVKMQNTALAGPFGGSAAFTQTSASRKRALEYRRRMRSRRDFSA